MNLTCLEGQVVPNGGRNCKSAGFGRGRLGHQKYKALGYFSQRILENKLTENFTNLYNWTKSQSFLVSEKQYCVSSLGHIFQVNKNGYLWQKTTLLFNLGESSCHLGGGVYSKGTVTLRVCTEQELSLAHGGGGGAHGGHMRRVGHGVL